MTVTVDPLSVAGPELDAWIQKQIFPPFPEDRCRVCGWPLAESIKGGCVKEDCSMRPTPARRADAPPCYSTKIEDAWRLIERMGEHGWSFDLSLSTEGSYIRFHQQNGRLNGYARSEPGQGALGVCLAAREALQRLENQREEIAIARRRERED